MPVCLEFSQTILSGEVRPEPPARVRSFFSAAELETPSNPGDGLASSPSAWRSERYIPYPPLVDNDTAYGITVPRFSELTERKRINQPVTSFHSFVNEGLVPIYPVLFWCCNESGRRPGRVCRMISVLIVEDEEAVREGLAALLALHQDLLIVGQAANGVEACRVAEALKPDVILLDIHMPERDGIQAAEIILRDLPDSKVLMLSSSDSDTLIVKALRAGACGYLLKNTKTDRIAEGIRAVYNGGMLLGPTVALKVVSKLGDDSPSRSSMRAQIEEKLSERRIEVLKLIGQGKSNGEIANLLSISEGTVKNYVSQIFEQLGLRDRVQAALIAKQELLVG